MKRINRFAKAVHIRPKLGESKEAFAKRFSQALIEMEQAYRKKHGLPPLTSEKNGAQK